MVRLAVSICGDRGWPCPHVIKDRVMSHCAHSPTKLATIDHNIIHLFTACLSINQSTTHGCVCAHVCVTVSAVPGELKTLLKSRGHRVQ